nr:VPLPA-CTERM sorting domain-containing protein [uncultured Desulfobacter sp.]
MKKSVFFLLSILILPLLQQTAHASIVFSSVEANSPLITNTVFVTIPQTVTAGVETTDDTVTNNTKVVSFEGTSMFGNGDISLTDTGVSMTTTAGGTSAATAGSIALSAYAYVDYTGINGEVNSWTNAINPDPVDLYGFVPHIINADINQFVSVSATETFTNTGDAPVSLLLEGFLDGLDSISFASFDSSTGDAEAIYEINNASVQVVEIDPDTGSSANWYIDLLDADSVAQIITAQTASEGYSYIFSASIVLTVNIDNLDGRSGYGEMDTVELVGDLSLGTLALNASLTEIANPVPVPSSLLLLISGVGGITFIRRRRG